MRRTAGLMSVLIACTLIFGFAVRVGAVKYLWQVALEEIEGSMQHEYAKKFVRMLKNLPDYFPECREKNIIPLFSSLYIPDNVKLYLTRNRVYAMGLGEDNMEVLNFEEVRAQD